MIFTGAQVDRHIKVLRSLEKNDLAETLSAYVNLVRRVAQEGEPRTGGLADRVPAGIVEEARRLRGT
jgi:hypothetical protein